MKKFIFTVLFLFISVISAVMANGNYENKQIMIFLYADGCRSCQQFEPIYEKLTNKFSNNYKFLKINIASENGMIFARQFNIQFVPYVVLIDNSINNYMHINEHCMFDYKCMEVNMDSFGN